MDYRNHPLAGLTDNGKTIRINSHTPNNENFLIVGDERYRLIQFHFHRRSEELVNGKSYDMAKIAAFAKRYPHNVRPVQPLNGRVVRATP